MADLFHLKEIIPEFEKHLAEKEEEKSERNAFLKYLGHNEGQIMVLTSGLAGKDKVSGFTKDSKMELKQKDTSFTYALLSLSFRITPQEYIQAVKALNSDSNK